MAFSYALTVANGLTDAFTVPFPYLSKQHVHVYKNGIEVSQALIVWTSPSTVQLPDIPASGYSILVRRQTPNVLPLVVFEPGHLSHKDINFDTLQLLYLLQENVDNSLNLSTDALHWDALGRPITHVGDALDAKDAVNLDVLGRKLTVVEAEIAALGRVAGQTLTGGVGGITPIAFGASGSGVTRTGTMTAGSPVLTLGVAGDFATGQGILVNHAGAAFAGSAPTGVGVSTQGVTGSTNWAYKIAPVNSSGGVGAASGAVAVTIGQDILGANDFNRLAWTSPDSVGTPTATAGWVIWRSKNGGAYTYHGSRSNQGAVAHTFDDVGQENEPKPFWVPATPPVSSLPNWLVTTVLSGGITTALTLAAVAGSSVAGEFVCHDDSTAFTSWINYLNAAQGSGALPAYTVFRITTLPPVITSPGVHIRGASDATILPAGASFFPIGYVFRFQGAGQGAAVTTTRSHIEGSVVLYLSDVSGFTEGGYCLSHQTVPAGGNAGTYGHVSKIRRVNVDSIVLTDPIPLPFAPFSKKITLSGSLVSQDSVTITVTGAFTGSPLAVNTLVQPYDTYNTVAKRLGGLLAGNVNFAISGAVVLVRGDLILVHSTVAYAWASTSTNLTITLGAGETPTLYPITLLENVGLSGVTIDMQNIPGQDCNVGYFGVRADAVASSTFENLLFKNCVGGAGFQSFYGYNNSYRGLKAIRCGDAFYSDLYFAYETKSHYHDIQSVHPTGFGWQIVGCTHIRGSLFGSTGTARGRTSKINATCNFSLFGINGSNSESTGFAVTLASWRGQIYGVTAIGSGGAAQNSVGVWMNDQYNNHIEFHGVTAFGNLTTDIAVWPRDTDNVFYGAVADKVKNDGAAIFYGLRPSTFQFSDQVPLISAGYDRISLKPLDFMTLGPGKNGIAVCKAKLVQSVVNGFTVNAPQGVERVIIAGAGGVATGTVVFPASPIDGTEFVVASGIAVTAITWNGNGAASIGGAPAGIDATTPVGWTYDKLGNIWYRTL